jgi:hypothetical protein
MKRMDLLLKENFELKKEIAFEKKKYMDLMNAFLELRQEINLTKDTQQCAVSDVDTLL